MSLPVLWSSPRESHRREGITSDERNEAEQTVPLVEHQCVSLDLAAPKSLLSHHEAAVSAFKIGGLWKHPPEPLELGGVLTPKHAVHVAVCDPGRLRIPRIDDDHVDLD